MVSKKFCLAEIIEIITEIIIIIITTLLCGELLSTQYCLKLFGEIFWAVFEIFRFKKLMHVWQSHWNKCLIKSDFC